MHNTPFISIAQDGSNYTLVTGSAAGLERRASVHVPGLDQPMYDVIPDCCGVRLRCFPRHLDIFHGQDRGRPERIYRSFDQGRSLVELEPPPVSHRFRDFESFEDGSLVAVEWQRGKDSSGSFDAWLRNPGQPWQSRPLPFGFRAESITRSPDVILYVVGGLTRPAEKEKQLIDHTAPIGHADEAIAVIESSRSYLKVPQLNAEDRAKINANWKFSKLLQWADVQAEPMVIVGRWLDYGRDCVMVEASPTWNVLDERQLLFCQIRRPAPGVISVLSFNLHFRTHDGGQTWQRTDFTNAINAAWPGFDGTQRLSAMGVDEVGNTIALIAANISSSEPDIIMLSNDGGVHFNAVPNSTGLHRFRQIRLRPE
jgi:hypothetical protein